MQPGQSKKLAEKYKEELRRVLLVSIRDTLDGLLLLKITDDKLKLNEQQIITLGPWTITGPKYKEVQND